MLYFTKFKSLFEKKNYLKIVFLYFFVLIFIMIISYFLIYSNYKNLKKMDLRSDYISNLSALSENIDNSFNELQYTSFLLSADSNLYDIFYLENKLDTADLYKIKAMTETLVKLKATKTLIDSVYVLHKSSNEVLDTSGTYDTSSFFSTAAIYEKYNSEFWENFETNTSFYQLLEPSSLESILSNSQFKRSVIPFVTSNIESFRSTNFLVINISELELTNLLNKFKLFESSKLFMINHQGIVFASTEKNLQNTIFENRDFITKIFGSKRSFFDYNINGSKTLVVTYTADSSKFNNFIYVALIPYDDFNQKLLSIKRITFSIIFLSLILSTILAYMMSRKIYNPIKNLIDVFDNGHSDKYLSGIGEIDYLNDQVHKILTNENSLKKDLSIVMPLVFEQYLTKIFTNNDFLLDESVKKFIQNNHIHFEFTDFSVSIVELHLSEKYYATYNNSENTILIKGITRLIKDILIDIYPTYIINLRKDRIGVLINLPENESLNHVYSKFINVVELFDTDRDLLSFGIGIGRVYSDYIGMNQSYNEALKALASLSPLSSEKVRLYKETTNNFKYHFSINDENKLYNYLIGCYKEEAMSLMKLLIQKFYQAAPSEEATKKFYFNMYNTIIRIIEEKNFSLPDIIGEDYIDIASNIEMLSISELNAYIFKLADRLLSFNNNSINVDISQITEYIQKHYHEDIYLEKVAQIFNTSDAYLSRLFKKSLGIGFHEYLVSIRVTKSKTLLRDSNHSVTKIGEIVGFNTHSTFFRVFKKYEGISPTQYRDSMRKS